MPAQTEAPSGPPVEIKLAAPFVQPAAAREIQQQCASNIFEIITLCRQHDACVVLTLILPPGKVPLARRLVWSDKIDISLQEINSSPGRHLADAEGVAVLDPSTTLAPGRSSANGFSNYRNTLHLQPAAYARLEPAPLRVLDGFTSAQREKHPPLNSNIPADQ